MWIIVLTLTGLGTFPRNAIAALNTTSFCGPDLTTKYAKRYQWRPLLFIMAVYVVFTPLTVYQICKHIRSQLKTSSMKKHSDKMKSFVSLSVRLVIYNCFLAGSVICWLYVNGEFVYNYDDYATAAAVYIECLVGTKLYGYDEGSCKFSDDVVHVSVYYMVGVIQLLVSISTFLLSCSKARSDDWNNKIMNSKSIQALTSRIKAPKATDLSKVKSMSKTDLSTKTDKSDKSGEGNKQALHIQLSSVNSIDSGNPVTPKYDGNSPVSPSIDHASVITPISPISRDITSNDDKKYK